MDKRTYLKNIVETKMPCLSLFINGEEYIGKKHKRKIKKATVIAGGEIQNISIGFYSQNFTIMIGFFKHVSLLNVYHSKKYTCRGRYDGTGCQPTQR